MADSHRKNSDRQAPRRKAPVDPIDAVPVAPPDQVDLKVPVALKVARLVLRMVDLKAAHPVVVDGLKADPTAPTDPAGLQVHPMAKVAHPDLPMAPADRADHRTPNELSKTP